MIVTSEVAGEQTPFETVHLNVDTPIPREVIVVVGDAGVVITGDPGPLTRDQRPVEGASGVLAAIVAEVLLEQNVWFGPALETGAVFIVSVMLLVAFEQGAAA